MASHPPVSSKKILYPRPESASLLSISLRSLDDLIARKELPVCRIGGRILIHRDELERFARRDHAKRSAETAHTRGAR